jgi:hypothetical protein
VRSDSVTPNSSLEDRRRAVAAALRAVTVDAEAPARPVTMPTPPPEEVADLRREVRRLAERVERVAERVERVEDKVDLIRDGDDVPLAWPVSVDNDNRLEVPPFEVARSNSPAFDVLLGPARRDSA